MEVNDRSSLIRLFIVIYFINATIEVVAESIAYKPIIYLTKPLIPLLLMVLYFYNSNKKDSIFFLMLFFSLATNFLFIPNDERSLFFGIICFSIHRIFLLILILKIVKIKDYIPFFLAILPLGFMFFYLFMDADIPKNSFYLIIFHNLIASVLGGIAISNYMMSDTKQNALLLTSILLFLGLQLVVFIEKYYLTESHFFFLRPFAMILNVLAFYTFYKFVITSEELNNN